MVEEIRPIHDKLFTPTIDNADENLTKICYDTAHRTFMVKNYLKLWKKD